MVLKRTSTDAPFTACDALPPKPARRLVFPIQLPPRLRASVGKAEVRGSLCTLELSTARERPAGALTHVYRLKRLCKLMKELTPEEMRRAVRFAVTRMIDTPSRSKELWQRVTPPIGDLPAGTLRVVDTGLGNVAVSGGFDLPHAVPTDFNVTLARLTGLAMLVSMSVFKPRSRSVSLRYPFPAASASLNAGWS